MPAHADRHGMTDESVSAVGSLAGGGGRAAAYRPVRPVAKLIGDVKIIRLAFATNAHAKEMPVFVRHHRGVMRVRHGVLVENVAGAHVPAVAKITRRAQQPIPA